MTDTLETVTTESATQVALYEANRKIALMEADWKKLNELMNTYANDTDWCSEYDEKLELWNSGFTTLQLQTRRKFYTVTVNLTLEYTNTIEVRANNEAAARDLVNDMTTYDVMEGLSIGDYNDSEWHASGAREGSL